MIEHTQIRQSSHNYRLNPADIFRFRVTVLAEGNEPEVHTVEADTEGRAKTTAMAFYSQRLAGQEVRYEIEKISV